MIPRISSRKELLKMALNMNPDERDNLLTWLQTKKDETRKMLTSTKLDTISASLLKGQLSAYSDVVAFIMSEGKLRD